MKTFSKTIKTMILFCLAVVTIVGVAASYSLKAEAADCAVKNGTYYITSVLRTNDSSFNLDLQDAKIANKTNIQIYTKKKNCGAQEFQITSRGNGWYSIAIASNTGMVLDVSGGKKASGVNVQLYKYNGTDAQLWKFEDAGNGYRYIKNKLGYYLDVSGGKAEKNRNVQVYSGNKSAAQKWRLTPKSIVTKSDSFIQNKYYKNGVAWAGSKTPRLSSYRSYGCCAYTADYAYYVAGCKSPLGVSSYTSPAYIEDGDIIKVTNSQHWFVVLERRGNKLTTIEGNWSSKVYYSTSAYTIVNGQLYRNGKKFRTFYRGYRTS